MANNKVEFGISNLYVGTYTVSSGGTVTLGTPYHQPGAVSFSPDNNDGDENAFYADNVKYWSEFTAGAFSGDLTVAKFDDTFKTQFCGYAATATGGIGAIKGATKPKVYVVFQVEGDAEARRVICYNCTLGGITRAYNTWTDTKTPDTETMTVNVDGDNATGLTMVTYKPDDSSYDTMFTAPPVPALPSN